MNRKPLFDRLSFRLTCGLVLALLIVGIPFFVVFYRLHERQLMESMHKPMSDLSRLILSSLERRMLERQPHLLEPDIRELAAEAGGARIMLFDKEGHIRVSSEQESVGKTLSKDEAECSSCHSQDPPADHMTLIPDTDNNFARALLVIKNEESCFSCHPASQKVNGTMIVDLPLAPATARLRSDMLEMLGLAALMVSVTILVLGVLVDRLIVKRIKALEKTTVAIRNGKLDERVTSSGNDEISELALSFNVMTASLKESLKEIERHKDYLENVINTIEDEIVVVDAELRIVTANAAYLRNAGGSLGNSTGSCCCSASQGGLACDVAAHAKCPTKIAFRSAAVQKCLHRFRSPEGGERYLEIYSYPIIDDQGSVFQVIEVRRDITERHLLEANLCHSERLASLGLLASGISHEINNPLASIVTCADGLRNRIARKQQQALSNGEEVVEYLTLISQEAMRAKAITERLLILGRKSDSVDYVVSVNRSLSETVLLAKFQADNKNLQIIEQYDPRLPEIKGNEPALRQIFLNLLMNAVECTEPGGRITLKTEADTKWLRVSVEDTGCGIQGEDLPHLFEPFFTRRTGRGTGLGLFISHTLVRQMGGIFEVRSREGKGSVFVVAFPLAMVAEADAGGSGLNSRWLS